MATNGKRVQWVSIDGNQMMRDSYNAFVRWLRGTGAKIEGFTTGGRKIYIKISGTPAVMNGLKSGLGEWCYYNPIQRLKTKPNEYNMDTFRL